MRMCCIGNDDDYDDGWPFFDHTVPDDTLPVKPVAPSWDALSDAEKAKHLRRALLMQQRLERSSTLLQARSTQDPQLTELATNLAATVAGLNQFFSTLAATSLFNERHGGVTTSRKVFDIPELLERILSFLDVRDLLRVQQVDKTMDAVVKQSKLLGRIMHLVPSTSGFLETPFAQFRNAPGVFPPYDPFIGLPLPDHGFRFTRFKCYSRPAPPTLSHPPTLPLGPPYTGRVTNDQADHKTIVAIVEPSLNDRTTVGSRIRDMLICQPPVTRMECFPRCCEHEQYKYKFVYPHTLPSGVNSPTPGFPRFLGTSSTPVSQASSSDISSVTSKQTDDERVITRDTGITIGDLYEAAEKLQKRHSMCPFAAAHHHDEEGNVKVRVTFAGVVKLKPNDPTVMPLPPPPPPPPPPSFPNMTVPPSHNHFSKMSAYARAKQHAFNNGKAIPTLNEWEETRDATEEAEDNGDALEGFDFDAFLYGASDGRVSDPPTADKIS